MGGKQNNIANVFVKSIPYRREFYHAKKETDESAEQWMCRVKDLAKLCSFGKYNDFFILDKFLMGLEPEIIDYLCSSAECLDMCNSLDIIHAYNAQTRDSIKSIQLTDEQIVDSDDQNEPEVTFSEILVKCSNLPINQTDVEGDDEQVEDDMMKGDFSPQNTSASESEDSLPKRKRKSSKKSTRYSNKKEKEKLVNAIENDPTTPKTKRKYKKRATKEKQFYECEICHYKCIHQCHLRRHKLIHLNEKAFICDICGKRFNLFINLNAHIRRHIGIRPFVCEICKASFMDRTRLKLHLRSHTGEKPFPCTVCEKKFADRYYLKVHMRLHTGEKPFQCDHCNKSFSQSSSLSLHKRKNCFISQLKEKSCN